MPKMKYFYFLCFFIIHFSSFSQDSTLHVRVSHLTGNFFIHTSYKILNKDTFPSNGLFVVSHNSIILFDTPWTEDQTLELIDTLKLRFHKSIAFCLVTHSHDDRTAGLNILKNNQAETFSSVKTKELCIEHNEKYAASAFQNDTSFSLDSVYFETYFPGEGHTKDNIVVWFPEEKILYGACIIKSVESNHLVNVADANLTEWPISIKRLIEKYPHINYVIPGHFKWSQKDALLHTLSLLEKNK